MLVGITITGLLAALLLPVVSSSVERARMASGASNLRQILVSMGIYHAEHNAFPPTSPTGTGKNEIYRMTVLFSEGYIEDPKIMINPANAAKVKALGRYGVFANDPCYFIARNVIASKWGQPWADVATPVNMLSSDLGVPIVWDQRGDLHGSPLNEIRVRGQWASHFGYADGSVALVVYPDSMIR